LSETDSDSWGKFSPQPCLILQKFKMHHSSVENYFHACLPVARVPAQCDAPACAWQGVLSSLTLPSTWVTLYAGF
jgi:hypothetical protein